MRLGISCTSSLLLQHYHVCAEQLLVGTSLGITGQGSWAASLFRVPSCSHLNVWVTLCWIFSGLYLTYCRLKTGHPAPDSDLQVLDRGELSTCPQCSLYHCVGALLNPGSPVYQDLRSPSAELLPNQSPVLHRCTEHSVLEAGLSLVSGGFWITCQPTERVTIFSLALFLAVLCTRSLLSLRTPACMWQNAQSPNGRKKAFSLFLKAEINQAICSIKRKLNSTSRRVSKLIPLWYANYW